jgi:hypothetical protein
MRVDHENNRKSDNRIRNLRLATHAQNLQNTGIKRISTTGLLGVSKTKTGRYQAQITAEGAYRSLGTFDTAEEAARVRDTAAIALHGRFAKLNAAIAAQTKTGE